MSEIISDEVKKVWPKSAPSILNINKYVEKYKNEIIVIKYGGNVLIDREVFNNFIKDIGILHKLGLSIIVVHGGGPRIKRELDKSNITSKFIKGLRVTDKKIIDIVENVLIDFNKDIVESLKLQGSKATSIHTKEKNILSVKPEDEELGFVGIPKEINTDILKDLILKKEIPVVAPLGVGKNKQSYNINGDTAAGAIAKSLKSRRLLLMTNVEGVLDNSKKLISEITSEKVIELIKNETINGGMIPKINTCLDAVKNGVRGVVIMDGRKPHSILNEIFSDTGAGTLIR